jgi:hypothetical protein
MSGQLTINYQGAHYRAHYESSSGFVTVDVSSDSFFQKAERSLGLEDPASVARMTALEILRRAKDRGELAD